MQIPFSNLWKGAGVMGDKMRQYRGLTFAAWGYIFLNFGFSIDGIQLLPEFVGYLLLLFAIGALFKECRNLLLLRPLCIVLAVVSTLNWVLALASRELGGHIMILDILVAVARLYFHFQFFTDIAALAKTSPKRGEVLSIRLSRCRTICTMLNTAVLAAALAAGKQGKIYYGVGGYILILISFVKFVTTCIIILTLFELRGHFKRASGEEGNRNNT